MADNNGCLDWDDVIDSDGKEYIVLPEDDYNFLVTKVEKGRFPGGKTLPPCNKATVTLQVKCDQGTVNVNTDLILHEIVLWKLSAFFRCIGLKKHGEKLTMDWNKVPGRWGRAHFAPRTYEGKNGQSRQTNDVESFIDYDDKYFPADEWPPVEEEMPF